MTTFLISNIGTRDIQLDTRDDLPDDIKNPRGELLPRLAGAYLRQQEMVAALMERIAMPMVEKALHYIAPRTMQDLQIVLMATDQPERTPAHFRNNDTIEYAHLMRDLLFQRYQRLGLAKKQIRVQTTANNPADYDVMYDYYREALPRIAERIAPEDQVYLLIAGGTPQMNTMLLFVGSEVFGAQACPIYVSPDKDRAATLDILRQIYAQALRRNLDVLLDAYAYTSAHHLVDQQPGVLEPWQESLLLATLHYAEARRNLNLEAAVTAFDATIQGTRALREAVRTLQQDVTDTSEQNKLQETIYLAQIAAETGNWADFLARLHRFSEGCMQLMAEELQVEWSKKTRAGFKESWWNANRALLHDLGLADAESPADPAAENRQREVDRHNLRQIVGRLAAIRERPEYLAALADLAVVDGPVPLRNDIVHRFSPISHTEVEKKAGDSVDAVITRMRSAYQHAFGIPVPHEHAYVYINRLCRRIFEGDR